MPRGKKEPAEQIIPYAPRRTAKRKAFDTLLEANGALRAVAAAHRHDPAAQ